MRIDRINIPCGQLCSSALISQIDCCLKFSDNRPCGRLGHCFLLADGHRKSTAAANHNVVPINHVRHSPQSVAAASGLEEHTANDCPRPV